MFSIPFSYHPILHSQQQDADFSIFSLMSIILFVSDNSHPIGVLSLRFDLCFPSD